MTAARLESVFQEFKVSAFVIEASALEVDEREAECKGQIGVETFWL